MGAPQPVANEAPPGLILGLGLDLSPKEENSAQTTQQTSQPSLFSTSESSESSSSDDNSSSDNSSDDDSNNDSEANEKTPSKNPDLKDLGLDWGSDDSS